jgi:hypothetical protein
VKVMIRKGRWGRGRKGKVTMEMGTEKKRERVGKTYAAEMRGWRIRERDREWEREKA